MPFTLSGATITQAGTDSDLSGLAGIAGVCSAWRWRKNPLLFGFRTLVVEWF